jgi:hypothetical protein
VAGSGEFAVVVGAQFAGVVAIDEGVVLHTSVRSSTDARVEICLFSTLSNMADYAGASDKTGSGWVSSASHGSRPRSGNLLWG